ncbi:hypothetical protein [Spiroplasma ixodetis]|uniref:ArsR family transcriptional regulator n=1 Tax=Spiroplasma ixodetis TaxID=2141 RepID=A0ABN6T4X1_9MOLU|nr:hypothetical protein [Spiroplasma ixodetis]BDT05201.1 hypothetical protein SHM_28470 [Spiroplasma ixodetis]
MEQIKILQIIDKWNYLNIKQISLLLNKNEATIRSQLKALKYKKLILVNKLTTKNIYYLSALGRRYFGKKSQSIKINFAESKLQNLLISWLTSQKEIIEYKTQLELKHDSPREKVFPNLLIWYKDNSIEWVEFERTIKNNTKWTKKINNLNLIFNLNKKYNLRWIAVNKSISNI